MENIQHRGHSDISRLYSKYSLNSSMSQGHLGSVQDIVLNNIFSVS